MSSSNVNGLGAAGLSAYCTWESSGGARRVRAVSLAAPSAAPTPQTTSRASLISLADWKRLVASREHAFANQASKPAGVFGLSFDGMGSGETHTLRTMSPSTSPSNGIRAVIAVNAHAPSDQMSVRTPGAPPTVSCSGLMKFGVPTTAPSCVGPPIGEATA